MIKNKVGVLMLLPIVIICIVITALLFWLLPYLIPIFVLDGNIMMVLTVSFIICTPIVLLYLILMELKKLNNSSK